MTPEQLDQTIRDQGIQFLDLRWSTLSHCSLHYTVPTAGLDAHDFRRGVRVGLSGQRDARPAWLIPDLSMAVFDPFFQHPTLTVMSVLSSEPDGAARPEDARATLARAVEQARVAGFECRVAARFSFHIFDQASFGTGPAHSHQRVDSREGSWRRGRDEPDNLGTQLERDRAAFCLPPEDSLHNLRAEIVAALIELGIAVRGHAHGSGTAGHTTIELADAPAQTLADHLMLARYTARNVAARHGKVATFMPCPLTGSQAANLELTLWLRPLVADALSPDALLSRLGASLGGLVALSAPTVNSFRRLGRACASGIPIRPRPDGELELEWPLADGAANPHVLLAALLAVLSGPRPEGGRAVPLRDIASNGRMLELLTPPMQEHRRSSALRAALQREQPEACPAGLPVPTDLRTALVQLAAGRSALCASSIFDADALGAWILDRWSRTRTSEEPATPAEFEEAFNL